MQLSSCPACSGLVPSASSACVHCGASMRASSGIGWLARRIAGLAGGTAFAITMMACYGVPPQTDTCIDNDGDEWFPACHEQPCEDDPSCDCDDYDPDIHPGAADNLGDNIDQNCDGADGVVDPPDAGLPDAIPPDAQLLDAQL